MTMKNRSFCKLIKPIITSSSSSPHHQKKYVFWSQNALHGPILRQYHHHRIPLSKDLVDTQPMRVVNTWKTNKSICERPPSILSTTKLSTYEILEPGIIVLRNYVGLKDQVDIVNKCQEWGAGPGGFYKPAGLQSYMMCFGRHWDPETGYTKRCRTDGSEPPQLPHEFVSLTEATVHDAQTHLNELPSMRPDNCLVNFYPSNGRWELHQDCDESSDSLRRGLPVVYISIGEMVEFVYGHSRDETNSRYVLLCSGDVFIFGGKSRLIHHGVTQVANYTSPRELFAETGFHGGHLSLTLRQFS